MYMYICIYVLIYIYIDILQTYTEREREREYNGMRAAFGFMLLVSAHDSRVLVVQAGAY